MVHDTVLWRSLSMELLLMRLFSRFTAVCLTLAALAFGAPAAMAEVAGTEAWSTHVMTLRTGPTNEYQVIGQIPADVAIKVLRCQRANCLVSYGNNRGWTNKRHVNFGLQHFNTPGKAPLNVARQICFYEGTNYTGASFCVQPGDRYHDLALVNADNRYASVQVSGRISATVCRDRDYQSYCERIINSQPVLYTFLNRNLSSVRAY